MGGAGLHIYIPLCMRVEGISINTFHLPADFLNSFEIPYAFKPRLDILRSRNAYHLVILAAPLRPVIIIIIIWVCGN